jgi:sulfopyruvate decarboxylase subunit beta
MMQRDECFAALAAERGNAIVVGTYTSAFEWERISPSPLNLPATGAMGQGSSHALGLALGLPGHPVFVLDGDGALLMNLGTLVTIANAAPKNLFHFLCENGTYEANGSHPLPGRDTVDFAGMARAAGYAQVFVFDDVARFAAELPRVLALDGPVFVTLKIVPGAPVKYDYDWMHGDAVRERFQQALDALVTTGATAAR